MERRIEPSVRLFAGHVPGRAGRAFLAVTPDSVAGFLELDGRVHPLSAGASRASETRREQDPGEPRFHCATPAPRDPAFAPPPAPVGAALAEAPLARFADVFVECSSEFRALFASDQAAVDSAVALFGASSAIFRRDVGLALRIPDGWLRVWNTTPPWGASHGNFLDIVALQGWWTSAANPLRDLERASVHLLTAPNWGGVAWQTPGACDPLAGFEVSALVGKFPDPVEHVSLDNWDLLVFTHEFGHTFGSPHTFDYAPPISCRDDSGPDRGTLMSGCHVRPGGVANVGMRFHPRVQSRIRATLPALACLEVSPALRGDWDWNGVLDGTDVSALLACLDQGFESAGCVETFDLDGDGRLTHRDLQLLELRIAQAGG